MDSDNEKAEALRAMAEADFDRFCTFGRIKKDRKRSNLSKTDFEEQREYILEEIQDGRITVDDDGRPTVIALSEDTPRITFTKRPAAVIMKAMDSYKTGQDIAKNMAVLSAACGVAQARLYALDYVDLRNVQAVFSMFLAD